MRSERHLDDAIDRAVGDIMSAEPRAGLRARVLERLDRPRANWFSVPRLAAAAVALSAMVLAVFMFSRPETIPAEQYPLASQQPPSPAPAVRPQDPPRPAPESPDLKQTPRVPVATPAFPNRGNVAAANVSETTVFPELPAVPRMLVIDGIPTPAIVFDKITVQPITIPSIVIDPLKPPR